MISFSLGLIEIAVAASLFLLVSPAEAKIEREEIRKAIIKHRKEIKSCYDNELKKAKKDIFGKIIFQWDIDENGRVVTEESKHAQKAKVVKDTLGNEKVSTCILNILVNTEFPKPPDGQIARVKFPFSFAAK